MARQTTVRRPAVATGVNLPERISAKRFRFWGFIALMTIFVVASLVVLAILPKDVPTVQLEQQADTAPEVVNNPTAQDTQPDAPVPAAPIQVQLNVVLPQPDIHQIVLAEGVIYALRLTGSMRYHVWRTNDDGNWNWQDLGHGTSGRGLGDSSIHIGDIKIPLPEEPKDRLWSGEPLHRGSVMEELVFALEKEQLAQELLGDLQAQEMAVAFAILVEDQNNPNVKLVGFALAHKDHYLPLTPRFFLTTDNQQTWEKQDFGEVEWRDPVLPFTTLAVWESPGGLEIFIGAKGLMHGIVP